MKTLVLGGCGFVGRHIIETFSNENMAIVVLDFHANPAHSTPHCTYVAGDFSDNAKIDALMARHSITHVIHLVSTTLPQSSNENKAYDVESNVIQTLHLLDLCVKHRVQRLLFMSSGGTVYGVPQQLPVDEKHPTNPLCSYGVSKLAVEKYLFLYRHLYGLDYVVLRAANPYGPGQNPLSGQGIVASFIHKISTGQHLDVWGDGNVVRDYFHVRDLANLTKIALISPESGIFNAGSGQGTSINQLIDMLGSLVGRPVEVKYRKERDFDVPEIVLDCTLAESTFGWRASTTLREGINECMDYCLTRDLV